MINTATKAHAIATPAITPGATLPKAPTAPVEYTEALCAVECTTGAVVFETLEDAVRVSVADADLVGDELLVEEVVGVTEPVSELVRVHEVEGLRDAVADEVGEKMPCWTQCR